MNTKIITHFTLNGRFNPDEITLSLGIEPSRTWRHGDSIQNTLLKYKEDGWRVSMDEKESLDLQECIQSLLDYILPYTAKIKNLYESDELKPEIACVINIENDQVPAVHINKEVMESIIVLNAELDIDIYLN